MTKFNTTLPRSVGEGVGRCTEPVVPEPGLRVEVGRDRAKRRNEAGFSIVEVLVSAAILSIVVIAVVAIIRKGDDMQSISAQRLAARVYLTARFEEHYKNGTFSSVNLPPSGPALFGDSACYSGDFYSFVDATPVAGADLSPIPVQRVTFALAWTDLDDTRDSIALTRWITE